MKIILSPAKSFNLENPFNKQWKINKHTQKIIGELVTKSRDKLKKDLKLSDTLTETVGDYIEKFNAPISYKAIEMYCGMVFKSLDFSSLLVTAQNYINENLLILSAFYGIVKPTDFIKPYRLDFTSNIKIESQSLKSFWKDYFNSYIKKDELVLNLASNEFSSLFEKENYNWIDFDFFKVEEKIKKRHSTIAKKGRGKLLRNLALNDFKARNLKDISKIEEIAGFDRFFSLVR